MQRKSQAQANVGDICMKKQKYKDVEVGHKQGEDEENSQSNEDEVQDINCNTPFSFSWAESSFKLKKWNRKVRKRYQVKCLKLNKKQFLISTEYDHL